MFFHAGEEGRDGSFSIAWFGSLAQAGFAVEEVEIPGIRHDNVMYDPFIREVTLRLTEAMNAAAEGSRFEQDAAAAS
jgi:hypothetical protein